MDEQQLGGRCLSPPGLRPGCRTLESPATIKAPRTRDFAGSPRFHLACMPLTRHLVSLSVCQSVSLSVCQSVSLSVCQFSPLPPRPQHLGDQLITALRNSGEQGRDDFRIRREE